MVTAAQQRWHLLSAAAITVLFRVPGVLNGLPYVRHPDEPGNYRIIHRMVVEHSILPRWYDYPSLQYDVQAFAHSLLAVVAKLSGAWQPSRDFGLAAGAGSGTELALSRAPWVLARSVTVVVATIGVLVAVRLATALCGSRRWGFAAGVLAATSGIGVATGSAVTPDALAGTTAILAVGCVLKLYSDQEHASNGRWLILTGVAFGLAVGTKYNNVLLIVAILAAHVTAPRAARPSLRRVAGLFAVGAAVFVGTTPAVFLDFHQFQQALRGVSSHYSQGHDGYEGNSLVANLGFLWRSDVMCVVLGAFALLLRRSRAVITIAVWVVAYTLLISLAKVRFDRNLTPVLGSAAVLAAVGAQQLWIQLGRSGRGTVRRDLRRALAVGTAGLLATAFVAHAARTIHELRHQLTDYQAATRSWTEHTLPSSVNVLLEPYSPWVDHSVRAVTSVGLMPYMTEEQVREADVLVLTSLGSGRYLFDSARYPEQAATVDSLRATGCRLERFDDGFGFWVEVVFLRCAGTGSSG